MPISACGYEHRRATLPGHSGRRPSSFDSVYIPSTCTRQRISADLDLTSRTSVTSRLLVTSRKTHRQTRRVQKIASAATVQEGHLSALSLRRECVKPTKALARQSDYVASLTPRHNSGIPRDSLAAVGSQQGGHKVYAHPLMRWQRTETVRSANASCGTGSSLFCWSLRRCSWIIKNHKNCLSR